MSTLRREELALPCLREMSGIGVGVGIEDLQQLSDRGDASAARMDVEKSMLLASLQDYNEKLVLEVTQLRDDNASLLDRVDEKDHLLQEREARPVHQFQGQKESRNVDDSKDFKFFHYLLQFLSTSAQTK